ncbi:Cof-type HAD-IIB family hydrolase [Mammaliicoccus lentus]|uniref:HAD family hydrolase n=1 Tax=Mammaliicoccus lentus TaxID=42858 RepID=UPI001C4E18D4|nr:HAD family hydrolase [Mammaliicoccus lentus]MBW0770905.1 Cof-type HAD-IIB family hydrolase [Mammaliicoccus lentus]
MENYKIVALDLDGTLLDSEKNIAKSTAQYLISIQKKFPIILITGRAYKNSKYYYKILNSHSYLVTNNGAQIFYNNSLITQSEIRNDNIEKLMSLSKKYKLKYVAFTEKDILFELKKKDILEESILKFTFIDIQSKQLNKNLVNEIQDIKGIDITNNTYKSIEINRHGVNKGTALQYIAKKLNVSLKECIVIGDSLNDLSMFTTNAISVAMGNAKRIIKENSDFITLDNDNKGVEVALKKLLNQRFY